ncbi:CPBP family intramembrane glutamic endopeptidase [Convivina praedatoris]|uniref:CAAX prenyl protease 2/Lysostaphin resistance protein A-like domain-containing protein n=1 Tax=Convivina praedatoris TaxID=2880963 RepID=A0ABN8HD92_9LACO|nr:type II CAAX endopeptidase family protein [Convivina sp. LMG 32447]CAH1852386.1 hypothetical protein R077815_00558 [Convivina sp. LMG 32447]CAH1853548.1 hypothetical protein R078138_00672 [Convivina sp. LMG 32447]CAH1854513.1 hypothetical protein LMG032447_00890 [Convivina sp. LMG 32447]
MKTIKKTSIVIFLLIYLKLIVTFDDDTAIQIPFSTSESIFGVITIGWFKLLSTIALILIIRFAFKLKPSFKSQRWNNLLKYGWPALLLALSNCTIYSDKAVWHVLLHEYSLINVILLILLGTTSAFIVGFFEEVVFRAGIMGVIINNTQRFPILLGVGVSSLLFGLVHALNYANQPFWDTTNQIISAIGIGSLFAAIYYLTQNLWIPIILHAIIDASSYIFNLHSNLIGGSGDSGLDLASFLVFIIFTVYSYYVLYQNQPNNNHKLLF